MSLDEQDIIDINPSKYMEAASQHCEAVPNNTNDTVKTENIY